MSKIGSTAKAFIFASGWKPETQTGEEGADLSHRFLALLLLQKLHSTSCEMGLLYPRPACSPRLLYPKPAYSPQLLYPIPACLPAWGALEVSLVIKLSDCLGLCSSFKMFLQTCGDPLAFLVRFSVHGSTLQTKLSPLPSIASSWYWVEEAGRVGWRSGTSSLATLPALAAGSH